MEESKKARLIADVVTIASWDASVTNRLPDEVDDSVFTDPLIQTIPNNKRRRGHCIILYLPAILEPIKLWNQTLITLGRNDKHLNQYPTVDLSEHHAALLGVSRIHAEITYENSNYYVQDMGSKNGTWVNKIKLILHHKSLLTNNDTLRLGHLMIQVSLYQDEVDL